MVTAAMTIAFGATPFRVIGEDELLEFTVTSGELVIRRLLRGFRLLYIIAVNGNRISLTIVLHIEPLSEIDRSPNSPIPEERDLSSLHPPLVIINNENTFLPGIPFQLRCPLCPYLLETGETCFHPDRGIKILRQSPEDTPSGAISSIVLSSSCALHLKMLYQKRRSSIALHFYRFIPDGPFILLILPLRDHLQFLLKSKRQ